MKLLLIRHGESAANAEGRMQGQFDSPLNDRGREQARALGRRLQREGWSASVVYASDLSRAAETAEIIADMLGLPIILDERLREYDPGVITGLVQHEIQEHYPQLWHDLRHSTGWVSIPESEGNEAFRVRMAAMASDILAAHDDRETVIVVAHGASLGMMLSHLLGLDTRRPSPFRFGNTALSILELIPRGPRLSLLNDTCHLDGDLR